MNADEAAIAPPQWAPYAGALSFLNGPAMLLIDAAYRKGRKRPQPEPS